MQIYKSEYDHIETELIQTTIPYILAFFTPGYEGSSWTNITTVEWNNAYTTDENHAMAAKELCRKNNIDENISLLHTRTETKHIFIVIPNAILKPYSCRPERIQDKLSLRFRR